jgi:hypothetical protein
MNKMFTLAEERTTHDVLRILEGLAAIVTGDHGPGLVDPDQFPAVHMGRCVNCDKWVNLSARCVWCARLTLSSDSGEVAA